jgi:hypothetical protein
MRSSIISVEMALRFSGRLSVIVAMSPEVSSLSVLYGISVRPPDSGDPAKMINQKECRVWGVCARTPPSTSQMLIRLWRKCFGCHSERSEESLPIQNQRLRGILREKSALSMTFFRIFAQSVFKVALKSERFRRG